MPRAYSGPMTRTPLFVFGVMLPLALSGCAVGKIVTAPIRVAGTVIETAVDATTQTRSEREEDVRRKVLKQRERTYKRCKKDAETRDERRECKRAYEADDW